MFATAAAATADISVVSIIHVLLVMMISITHARVAFKASAREWIEIIVVEGV
jgi:hypothetical protein